MKLFVVLLRARDLNTQELKIALRSFAFTVAKVTPRHRKVLRLRILTDSRQRRSLLPLLQRFELTEFTDFTSSAHPYLVNCQVLFSPNLQPPTNALLHSLAAGVPVLTYESNTTEQYVDSSCSILIPYRTGEKAAQIFSDYLRMLYFDPAAQRILQKGAIRRSQRQPIPMAAATTALSMAS